MKCLNRENVQFNRSFNIPEQAIIMKQINEELCIRISLYSYSF